MITKNDFIKIMNALESQYRYDEKYCNELVKALGFEEGAMYNNEELVECIVAFLASNFEESEKAGEKIKDFMYDFDFGRNHSIINSPEKLWMVLLDECVLKSCDSKPYKKSRSISVAELEMTLNNITNLTAMYKRVFFKDGSDSELQNITNALDINIDFLKGLILKGGGKWELVISKLNTEGVEIDVESLNSKTL